MRLRGLVLLVLSVLLVWLLAFVWHSLPAFDWRLTPTSVTIFAVWVYLMNWLMPEKKPSDEIDNGW